MVVKQKTLLLLVIKMFCSQARMFDLDIKVSEKNNELPGPIMDYDDSEDYDEYDDYDDYDNEGKETPVSNRMEGRLRQMIKNCEFIDLTALGPMCNSGRKIKYYKV